MRSREKSGEGLVEHRYRRDGDQMIAAQTVDGKAQPERRIAASAETALSILDQQAVEPGEVRAGMSARFSEFETAQWTRSPP